MLRTNICSDINERFVDKKIILSGWINKIRKYKNFFFLDLRDRYGKMQLIVFLNKNFLLDFKLDLINLEDCIMVYGKIKNKGCNQINSRIEFNLFELIIYEIFILSKSLYLPINIHDENISEDLRMKNRHIDLRRKEMQDNLILKHKAYYIIFNFFNDNGFLYIETPNLIKYTPFGSNNFIVPSSKNKMYFVLSESPQIFKQLLMISCFDKYFQFSKCFRNEDMRKDRQLEFNQIDFEMSFVEIEDILTFIEKLLFKIFLSLSNLIIGINFPRITYENALLRYGSDKPDIRCDFEFINVLFFFNFLEIKKIFSSLIKNFSDNFFLKCLILKKNFFFLFDLLLKNYKILNDNELFIFLKTKNGLKNIVNDYYLDYKRLKKFIEFYDIENYDIIFFFYGDFDNVIKKMSEIRNFFINNLLKNNNDLKFLWVIEFPLFNYNFKKMELESVHHPFTSPLEYNDNFVDNLFKIKSKSYDLVINGVEVGGGSIRINNYELQKLIFQILNSSNKETLSSFDFFLNSFKISVPPHGGMAIGIDRLCMFLKKSNSIREFIAFPKSLNGIDLFMNSPNPLF